MVWRILITANQWQSHTPWIQSAPWMGWNRMTIDRIRHIRKILVFIGLNRTQRLIEV